MKEMGELRPNVEAIGERNMRMRAIKTCWIRQYGSAIKVTANNSDGPGSIPSIHTQVEGES